MAPPLARRANTDYLSRTCGKGKYERTTSFSSNFTSLLVSQAPRNEQ
jgi:uncharacterized iron-regulated protein